MLPPNSLQWWHHHYQEEILTEALMAFLKDMLIHYLMPLKLRWMGGKGRLYSWEIHGEKDNTLALGQTMMVFGTWYQLKKRKEFTTMARGKMEFFLWNFKILPRSSKMWQWQKSTMMRPMFMNHTMIPSQREHIFVLRLCRHTSIHSKWIKLLRDLSQVKNKWDIDILMLNFTLVK